MARQKRLDSHRITSYSTTPENDENIKRIKSTSASWKNPICSTGDVIIFCIEFVAKNLDIIGQNISEIDSDTDVE